MSKKDSNPFNPTKKNPDSQPYNEPVNPKKRQPFAPKRDVAADKKNMENNMMNDPKNFGKSKDVVFDTSWDLMKFGDCPVCLGDHMACPTPDVPMSACGTRRNAIKHMMRGKGGRPPMILRQ